MMLPVVVIVDDKCCCKKNKSHHQLAGPNLDWLNPLVAGGKYHYTPHSLMEGPLCLQIKKLLCEENYETLVKPRKRQIDLLTLGRSLGMYQPDLNIP